MRRLTTLVALPLLLSPLACGPGEHGSGDPELAALTSLANQNAGTTPTLDLIAESPLRDECAVWYGNDLCSVESEAVIHEAVLERLPDIMMFEEVWDQARCEEPDRPEETFEHPFACSAGTAHQLIRVLPDGYSFACSEAERDAMACVSFRDSVFVVVNDEGDDVGCPDRDCSSWLQALESDCEHQGHMSYLRGRTAEGATTLAVMHLYVDLTEEDDECRAAQVQAMHEALAALPSDERIVMAGDFNIDPDQWEGPDVDAVYAMADDLGLDRIETAGPTHMLLDVTIDLLFTRGWAGAETAECEVTFLDEGSDEPMIDHALVSCR